MNNSNDLSIPKVIHYCWFGRNPLPDMVKKCIDSWKKYCPDYEIIEWNEDNYDIKSCDYVREAYLAKKWAFISDVVRFEILYKYGGLYFDTDVELIKQIDDIVEYGSFMARETGEGHNIAPGLVLGTYMQNKVYKEIVDYYKKQHFIREDGSYDKCTVVTRITNLMLKHGFDPENYKEIQEVWGIKIYPAEYFCPKDYTTGAIHISEHTVAIHHYQGSWHNDEDDYYESLKETLHKFLPGKFGNFFAKYVATLKYHGFLYASKILYGWFKRCIKNMS